MTAPIILASASPRRAALLTQVRLPFEVQPADIDESVLPGEPPGAYVIRLARAKAAAVPAAGVVIAADTTVVSGGRILGKPADQQENARMLRRLSGSVHQVHTGVAVRRDTLVYSLGVVADVWFRTLDPAEIAAYVATEEGLDKAGGYGIQGLGSLFVSRIAGSYSAVVGLPLAELEWLLQRAGVKTWRLRGYG